MSNNRNPIKQWEITFPQSGDTQRELFYSAFPPCDYAITCKEEHEDGSPHLHLGIKLLKGLSHAKMLKWVKGKFPEDWKRIHFSPIKNWENFNNYCMKEDPHTFIVGELADPSERLRRRQREQRQEELNQVIEHQEYEQLQDDIAQQRDQIFWEQIKLFNFRQQLKHEAERAREHGIVIDIPEITAEAERDFIDNYYQWVDRYPNDLEQVRIGQEEQILQHRAGGSLR